MDWITKNRNGYCYIDALEKEFLKREQEYREQRINHIQDMVLSKKENDKLKKEKQEIQDLSDKLRNATSSCAKIGYGYKKDVDKIKEENKQLKKEVRELQNTISSHMEDKFRIIDLIVKQEFPNTKLNVRIDMKENDYIPGPLAEWDIV